MKLRRWDGNEVDLLLAQAVNMTDTSHPITEASLPYTVRDREGAVLYIPPQQRGRDAASFQYKLVCREALAQRGSRAETAEGVVRINISPTNTAPAVIPKQVSRRQSLPAMRLPPRVCICVVLLMGLNSARADLGSPRSAVCCGPHEY